MAVLVTAIHLNYNLNMSLSMRTIKAIIYNLILPGAGYLYIGAKDRYLLAVVLVGSTVYHIFLTMDKLIDGRTEQYIINISPFFPGLTFVPVALIFIVLLIWDTYRLSKKTKVTL